MAGTKAGRRGKGGRAGSAPRRTRAARSGAPSAGEQRRVVAEMRAFAHPLRLRLFELFAEKPRTTMQVAELLGQPPTRLYHHVNALEKAGLLRLKETRPIRGTVEKYYEAVYDARLQQNAKVLRQSPAARRSARAAAGAVFEQARQDLFADLGDLPGEGEAAPMLLRMIFTATPARATAIRKRVLALLKQIREECGEAKGKAPEGNERWSLTLALARAWPRQRAPSE